MRNFGSNGGDPAKPPLKDDGIRGPRAIHGGETADTTQDAVSAEERILTNPLFGEPVIKTGPAREAYHSLRERLLGGISGFTVLGQRRMDLPGTLGVMRHYLMQEYPRLAVYEHLVSRRSPRTESDALSNLLHSMGHRILRGSHDDKIARLLNMQEEQALVSGSPLSIWVIHNAELLDVAQCKVLLEMRGHLELKGIRLFLVHGAHVDSFMTRIRKLVRGLSQSELRTLFGTVHALRGLSGLQEYADVLMEIDTLMVSQESPVTWTQALLPKAYERGFRLTSQAPALHAAILTRNPDGAFPNRALFDAIRSVMSTSARYDSPNFKIPQELWAQAVTTVMGIGSSYLQSDSGSQSLIHTW